MMILGEDFIPIMVLLTFSYSNTAKPESCPTENLVVNLINITWKIRQRSRVSVVTSEPPCLDINKNLVIRACSNGTWWPSEKCHYVDVNKVCPINFDELREKCTYVTPPQTWEKKCPTPGESTLIKDYNNIWLPIKQTTPYGAYEYVLPDENYGLQYYGSDSSESSDEILELSSECVVKKVTAIESISCDANFSRVCTYKYNNFLYRCPDDCVPGGLGSNYCFCKRYKNHQPDIQSICNVLAPLTYSYERSILYKLAGRDTCLIGYSQTFDNLHLTIHKNLLFLKKIEEVNCAICKVASIPFDAVDMKLQYNAKSQKLYLDVYSPEGLYKIDDNVQIYCFTDATNKLKYRVRVEKQFDSNSRSGTKRRYAVFKVYLVDDGPGYYWCEAFLLPHMDLLQSNKVIAHKKFKYNEYSLRIDIHNLCRYSLLYCKLPTEDFISGVSKSLFATNFFSKFIKNVRLFRIYDINFITDTAYVLLHVSAKTKLSLEDEYHMIRTNLSMIEKQNVTIVFFTSSTFCFAHNTSGYNVTLHWETSPLDTFDIPTEVCIKNDGLPLTRKCQGDFHIGASWENITDNCAQNYTVSSKTQLLHSMVSGNLSIESAMDISNITNNPSDLTVLDIYYLSKTLGQLSNLNQTHSVEFIVDLTEVINNLMHSNASTLKYAQAVLNATDELLDIFENTLNSASFENDSIIIIQGDLIIHATKPFINNISGISLHGEEGMHFSKFTVKEIYSNTSFDTLVNETNIDLAAYIPENLLNVIAANTFLDNLPNITVITTVFYTDNFFNTESDPNETVGSKIVSVSISDYGDYLEEPIPILFKSRNEFNNTKCVFWNYGLSADNHMGYWSTLGGDTWQQNYTNFEKCLFSHLTNFALLVRNEYNVDDDDPDVISDLAIEKYHDDILTIISNVGCTISAFGISGIFITGVLFKCWRVKVGTRILMQLCIAIFLQIIFLNVATVQIAKATSATFCKAVGVILHYVTIAEFSWMLVAAVLQFYRFVKVIGSMPNRIILRAALVGWGLPLIPIILTCAIDIESYSIADEGICYPTGMSLYLGVLLPILLIITTNLAVFIAVIFNIFQLKVEPQGQSQTILKRQICLAILLFFLLGLPWTFGLIAQLMQGTAFSYIFLYLFCFTATLQGFVLFIFYVVLDRSTRLLWCELFKKLIRK